ncbi:phage antirepressor N-terminal domain-containing protein [Catenuloplanes japonicus]|uniref:phage antirepressor N-terminal domain-containing protein n=1 Tax=Catenuloplanes japonicus TaxID=33876 RepID=UPI00068C70BD|nr:phage antirepressor N-terminal domain-containing protein [Catenuloplanes japonicus]
MTTPTAEIVLIPFHGAQIHSVMFDGEPHVVLKPTLEEIGIDYSTQLRKIRGRSWATVGQCPTVAEDGKVRDMAVIGLDAWAMLLANIHEDRVAAEVKPLLVEYQSKSAKALREFWTKGGAINEAASDEQLADLADEIEAKRADRARRRLELLALMGGIADPVWLDGRARHEYALVVGEKPDIAPEDRLLTVDGYLVDRGVPKADLVSIRSTFGKKLKGAYVLEHGENPGEVLALVNGRERSVKAYYERDRHLFDQVFDAGYAHLAPAMLPGVAA